jgi:outer membrane lipoprotein-sorting protein
MSVLSSVLARSAVFLIAFSFSLAGVSQPLGVNEVIHNLISSYGGEINLLKLESQVQQWNMTALMSNRKGTDERTIQMPDMLRVELTYPHKKEVRLLNGNRGVVIFDDDRSHTAAPAQRDAMRLQLMRLYSPLVLRDKIDKIELTDEGDLCALTLFEHGVRTDYLISKEHWRIEKVAGSLEMNGAEMQFLTEYSNFEKVDGVLLHRRENKFAGNINTAILELRRVTFNPTIDEKMFDSVY